jgi:hypothetical protein
LIFVATEQGNLSGSRGCQIPARDGDQSLSVVPDGSAYHDLLAWSSLGSTSKNSYEKYVEHSTDTLRLQVKTKPEPRKATYASVQPC